MDSVRYCGFCIRLYSSQTVALDDSRWFFCVTHVPCGTLQRKPICFLGPLYCRIRISFIVSLAKTLLHQKSDAIVTKKRMPSISATERTALQSGDAWWEKDLLSGNPNWNKLLDFPKPALTEEEQSFLDNQVDTLCAMIDDFAIVHQQHDLPKKIWQYAQQEKFFGLVIPKEFGGLGFSAIAHSSVIVKIAARSVSAAVNIMVPNSLGPGELLLRYGTADQKEYYLPRLANGTEIPCFALTDTNAGSDATAISDIGIVCYQRFHGQKTLGIHLNWDKRYITLAPIATLLGLAIHLYDPEHLLGSVEDIGITLCLIPTDHPGVEIGRRHLPLYLAFMNGPTRGKDVFIPLNWIIGGQAMAGHGWKMLMESLSVGRSISLPALSSSCAKLTYCVSGAYARLRQQFNVPIGYFEGVQELLSSVAGYTYLLEAARVLTAGAVDQKIKPTVASAIAKYHMTEIARMVINKAMDVNAGHAIQMGPHNLLANVYVAMPISITVEGANALTRNLIIFGQGVTICHPYLLPEIECLSQETIDEQSLEKFDSLLLNHLGFTLSNFARAIWYALSGGRLIFFSFKKAQRHKKVIRYYQQLTVVSNLLACVTDIVLLILGGNLKKRERISARLGDVLSHLYLASSVLKYFQDQDQPAEELMHVEWCMQTCLHHAQEAFKGLANNFPLPWVGKLLHLLIPYGTLFTKPSDALSHQIIEPMLSPSAYRERVMRHLYQAKGKEEWLSHLEAMFHDTAEAEVLLKKLRSLVRHGKVPAWISALDQIAAALKEGLLTQQEADSLVAFEKQREDILKVSEFSFDLNKVVA